MKKSTFISIVVFIGLLVAVIYVMNQKAERGITRFSLTDLAVDQIDKIVVSGANPVELKRNGDEWRVLGTKEKQADANAVKRVLDMVPKINSSDLISRNKERYAEFEVDEEKGARIKLFAQGKIQADFVVGKSARGGSYVKTGKDVYLVSQIYASTFSRENSAWLERKLFSEKATELNRVEVSLQGQTTYTLVKKEGQWVVEDQSMLPKAFRFDNSQASSFVSTLVNVRAKDILDVDPGTDTTKLVDQGDVLAFYNSSEDDKNTKPTRQLWLGALNEEDKAVYIKVGHKQDIMTITESTAKNLRKHIRDFRDLKMLKIDQEKITQLKIIDGKKRIVLEKQGAEWKIGQSTEKITKDFVLDPMAINRRLTSFVNARGAGIAEGISVGSAGLNAPSTKIVALLDDKKTVSLDFGRKTKKDDRDMLYARGNADSAIYLVNKWTKNNLCGGIETFQQRPDPGNNFGNIDPSALSKLPPDVRKNLMQQLRQKQAQQQMFQQLQMKSKQKSNRPKQAQAEKK